MSHLFLYSLRLCSGIVFAHWVNALLFPTASSMMLISSRPSSGPSLESFLIMELGYAFGFFSTCSHSVSSPNFDPFHTKKKSNAVVQGQGCLFRKAFMMYVFFFYFLEQMCWSVPFFFANLIPLLEICRCVEREPQEPQGRRSL
jgi:hypothetical protein